MNELSFINFIQTYLKLLVYNIIIPFYRPIHMYMGIRGYFQHYALYKSTFYLLTYLLTYTVQWCNI